MSTFVPPSFDRSRRRQSAASPRGKSRSSWRQRSPRRPRPTLEPTPTPRPRRSLLTVPRFRLILVWGILLFGMLSLAINLFRLQVLQANVLQERAQQQQVVNFRPFLPRRPIVDREGTVLAIDRPVYTLYAHPVLFKEPAEAIAAELAPILERPVQEVLEAFQSGDSGIRIANALPEEVATRVLHLNTDGLELLPYQQRLYPQEDLFANLVGYVDVDRQGQAGLEFSQTDWLEQPLEEVQFTRAGDGSVLPGVPDALVRSDHLQLKLTVDSRLQRTARFRLQQQLEQFDAKRGTVIVMDVQDGSLLSLVTEPSYDPNRYYESDVEYFKNWAISDSYEPGSTFKPINVAIALETDAIQPTDTFYDPGHIEVGGWPIENFDFDQNGGRGTVSVTDILKDSSNVGMVQIMQQLPAEDYYEWLKKLGLGEITGIDLPFEASGYLKSQEEFTGALIEPATAAFGQGLSLTPIQMAQLQATLANGGTLVTPYVVEGLADPDGTLRRPLTHPVPQRIFSPESTRSVLEMMETVVRDGTGQAAQVEGYRIAGKTGTAQKAGDNGAYLDGVKITSFVAIFPVEAPRYVVLVVVDEPEGADAFGSTVAAPVAKTMIEALITMEQIPPYTERSPVAVPSSPETTPDAEASPEPNPTPEGMPTPDTTQT